MKKKHGARVSKPRDMTHGFVPGITDTIIWKADPEYLDLKSTKKLHAWLTKAIKYLESRSK